VIKEKDVGLPPFGPDLSLISRLFSGFDFGFALTFCFPPIFSVTPRLRAESPPWWVSVVNIGFWLRLRPFPRSAIICADPWRNFLSSGLP